MDNADKEIKKIVDEEFEENPDKSTSYIFQKVIDRMRLEHQVDVSCMDIVKVF